MVLHLEGVHHQPTKRIQQSVFDAVEGRRIGEKAHGRAQQRATVEQGRHSHEALGNLALQLGRERGTEERGGRV
ncbi:MAG: hypothetical protein IPN16_14850 [Gemmatimonadetes bacterium]|nr:hypothetical protein [Gemmatimonadota bacterium]